MGLLERAAVSDRGSGVADVSEVSLNQPEGELVERAPGCCVVGLLLVGAFQKDPLVGDYDVRVSLRRGCRVERRPAESESRLRDRRGSWVVHARRAQHEREGPKEGEGCWRHCVSAGGVELATMRPKGRPFERIPTWPALIHEENNNEAAYFFI